MADTATIHVGRRKSSVARVRLTRGSGEMIINGRPLAEYFPTEKLRGHAIEPFFAVDTPADADDDNAEPSEPKAFGKFDVHATVNGGGMTGQAGAVRLGIARALTEQDPDWRAPLKKAGMLTRDARKVERKKFGLHKARRAPQFSKR